MLSSGRSEEASTVTPWPGDNLVICLQKETFQNQLPMKNVFSFLQGLFTVHLFLYLKSSSSQLKMALGYFIITFTV